MPETRDRDRTEARTLTLLTPSGPLEITTFRTESGYSDCRHPDRVSFVRDIHADLARRDFTVNAMAYSPVRGLRDDFGGREDLGNGVLRCVGDPGERFREDALRILRALRFAARFGLTIEEKTAAALRENRELLRNISPERIFSELKGILCARGAGRCCSPSRRCFFVILPELAPMRGFDTRRPQNHCWDVWGHTAHAVDAIAPESVLRLTMLFHDSGKPETFRYDAQAGFGRFPGHPAVSARIADAALRRLAATMPRASGWSRSWKTTRCAPATAKRTCAACWRRSGRRICAICCSSGARTRRRTRPKPPHG